MVAGHAGLRRRDDGRGERRRPGRSGPGPMAMIADVVAEPITLSADERYFCGHYLAYLLGGSRRRGFLRRRPLDPLNADRARLDAGDDLDDDRGAGRRASSTRAAELLESRYDVRPSLSPIVVTKYLATRDTPAKRKAFRQARKRLQEASPTPRATDDRRQGGAQPRPDAAEARRPPQGLAGQGRGRRPARRPLEPGGRGLADPPRLPPGRARLRDDLRLARPGQRRPLARGRLPPDRAGPLAAPAPLEPPRRPGTTSAASSACPTPASGSTGRSARSSPRRWSRSSTSRSTPSRKTPSSTSTCVVEAETRARGASASGSTPAASTSWPPTWRQSKGFVRLAVPDPVRLTMGDLRDLWQEAVAALKTPGSKTGHRHVPIGPYRLAVIPSIRGKSAGQIAIQGMPNKQIEMLIPSIRLASSVGKPILAVWPYQDDSLAIAYVDYRERRALHLLARPDQPAGQLRRRRRPQQRPAPARPRGPRPARPRPLQAVPAQESRLRRR